MTTELAIATEKLQAVETLVKGLAEAEQKLEHGYAKLAYMLEEVAEKRYWTGTYESFGAFLDRISGEYSIGKSQLYNYRSAARDLEGSVTQDQMDTMGISKALVLREAKNSTGLIPEKALIAALEPKTTTDSLKKLLFESQNPVPLSGKWRKLDFSCYYDDDEAQEIGDAMNAARHGDPVINQKLPDHMQFKEILLRFAREFLGAHADSVVEGGRGL